LKFVDSKNLAVTENGDSLSEGIIIWLP